MTNARGQVRGRGQIFEAEDKILASRTAWSRGLNITGLDLVQTWLVKRLLPLPAKMLASICNATFHERVFPAN